MSLLCLLEKKTENKGSQDRAEGDEQYESASRKGEVKQASEWTDRAGLPLETEAAGLRLGPATVDLPLDLFEIPLKTMTVTPTQYYLLRGVFPDHRVSHGPPSPGSFFSQKELY